VVLNRVGSDRHLAFLKSALEPLGLPVLGVLHRQDAIRLPDRHLGLVPTDELPALDEVVDRLAHLGETCFDWPRLLPKPVRAIGLTAATRSHRWPARRRDRRQ